MPAHLTKNRAQAIVPLHPKLVSAFREEKKDAKKADFIFPHYKNPDPRFQRHRREAGIKTIDETGRKLDLPNNKIGTHAGTQNADISGHFLSQTDTEEKEVKETVNPLSIKEKTTESLNCGGRKMVGETGFEPATSGSQSRRSTKLSYSP